MSSLMQQISQITKEIQEVWRICKIILKQEMHKKAPENPEHTPDNDENPDNSLEEDRNPTILRNELSSRKSHIEYKVKKEDSWQEAVVINRAGKTT